jgi:hypothetical protein
MAAAVSTATAVEATTAAAVEPASAGAVAAPGITATTVGCPSAVVSATVAIASAAVIATITCATIAPATTTPIATTAVIATAVIASTPATAISIPGTGPDEHSAGKPVWPVVAIRRTPVRRVSIVAVSAYRRSIVSGIIPGADAYPHTDLSLRVRQRNRQNCQQNHIL